MTDSKLRPEDLTVTVSEVFPPPPPIHGWLGFYYDSSKDSPEDTGWYCSGRVHPDLEDALCELAGFRPFEGSALVEVGRALFAPAPVERVIDPRNEEEYGDAIRSLLAATQPAPSEAAKVECPMPLIDTLHARAHGRNCTCSEFQEPAQPEPAVPEMPDAVATAISELRSEADEHRPFGLNLTQAADALASWWRNSAQPVRMTEELEAVLDYSDEYCSAVRDDDGQSQTVRSEAHHWSACIAAVRQQAAQPVRLEKVREFIRGVADAWLTSEGKAKKLVALAEIDRHEGKGEGRG